MNTAERIYLAAQPSYVLTVPTTTTYYWVRAIDGATASLWSSHVAVAPLRAPTNVVASLTLADSIEVTWDAETNPPDFVVYRNETTDFESAAIHAVVDGSLRSYSDHSAMPQLDYYYWIGSVDAQDRAGATSRPEIGRRSGREIFEFGEQLEFSSNSHTLDVDLEDFNQDGYLDLFVTNTSTVEIWLNDQSGRLTSPVEIRVPGEQLVYADVGDVNNDGFPDAVTTNQAGPPLLWINNGDGTFTDPQNLFDEALHSAQTHDVAIVDLDGDSWNDLYLVTRDGPDTIWRNETVESDGVRFTDVGLRLESQTEARSKGVEIEDLNNDGCWDAFIANENTSNVIYYGIGFHSAETTSCELPKSSADRHLPGIAAANQYNNNLVNVAVTLGSNTVSYTHLTLPTICSV